jgi:molybdenum cofactor synthesis domain-containing protein
VTDVQLLDKTEIWIRGVRLADADLAAVASAAATALALPPARVFVTDVRDDHVVLDVLLPRVRLEDVAGTEAALLAAIGAVRGVSVATDASVHSEGVLGVIGTAPADVAALLQEVTRVDDGIRAFASRRVAVVSTGADVLEGRVRDTNLAAVREVLEPAGYEVASGGTVADDERAIAGRVARLADEGYGVVITTGGVGAEDKDRTVEALALLDPALATAVLAYYRVGCGRHVKDSVRVAVARVGWGIAVALPGPTHEVRLALPVLVDGLAAQLSVAELAEVIARPLRAILPHGGGTGQRPE